jgi:hypothetical protein
MRLGTLLCLLATLAFPTLSRAQWDSDDDDVETFRWRGRVDGVDDVVIRGSEVRIEHISAQPIQRQEHRFSAPLPPAEVELHLEVVKGRGDVRILEQPTRRNDYTAVVRVDDQEHSGDADYEFELSWSRRDWDGGDAYDASFRWRGRVDIGCRIEVRGDGHEVEDMGGQGTRERDFRFSEPLPSDEVPVSVEKKKGRGKVRLVEMPRASNDYTAVVEIEDDKGGADDYEIELRWQRR